MTPVPKLAASLVVLLMPMMLSVNALSLLPTPDRNSFLRMDMEGSAYSRHVGIPHSEKTATSWFQRQATRTRLEHNQNNIQAAMDAAGMPWRCSIQPSFPCSDGLAYMPFWEWQLDFMQQHLTNLTVLPTTSHDGSMDFSYHDTNIVSKQDKTSPPARIVNLAFSCEEYRKIRMTYYDAGPRVQVFNSLWYPRHNLPVLGIDLLQFQNGKKHLCVIDYQPIVGQETSNQDGTELLHDAPYHALMEPIVNRYTRLQGSSMSNRFYDESQFFSPHKLFTRFDNASLIQSDVFPAFQDYVTAHVCELVQPIVQASSSLWLSESNRQPQLEVLRRQRAYDVYSADRDPATAMFARVFGQEWADTFVHEFLFELSRVEDLRDMRRLI